MQSLTALERETVISMNDEEDITFIHTSQKTWITSLRKNPAATLIEEGKHGTTMWAKFELPYGLITVRKGKRIISAANKKGFAKRMAATARCTAKTVTGEPCKGKAINGSGKCFRHK